MYFFRLLLVALIHVNALVLSVAAQQDADNFFSKLRSPGTAQIGEGNKMILGAKFELLENSRFGEITLSASIEPQWHTYSITQLGGPGPSKIKVVEQAGVRVLDSFKPDQEPEKSSSTVWPDVTIEKHKLFVSWKAPIYIADEIDVGQLEIALQFDGQVCDETAGCIPFFGEEYTARFDGYLKQLSGLHPNIGTDDEAIQRAAPQPSNVEVIPVDASVAQALADLKFTGTELIGLSSVLTGEIDRKSIRPGDEFMIRLSFKVNEGSHIYQIHEDVDSLLAYLPTLLRLYPHRGFSVVDLSSSLPISEHESYGIRTAFYDGPVELTIRLKAEDDIQLGEHELVGAIGYQTCKLTSCDPPTGAVFTSRIQVTDRDTPASTEPNPLEFAEVDYRFGLEHQDSSWVHPKPGTRLVASRALAGTTASSVRSSDIEVNPAGQSEVGTQPKQPSDSFLDRLKSSNEEKASIFVALGFALLGGFVLNFMPCVLPVIGLKVMSFVQQAGANRVQAFVLNVWYTVGILSVFMVLATLSVLLKLGWGDQSQFAPFQIGMAALVFVMSLAFFGIWEIPIPGFVGSSKAAKVAEQEGPLAALTKGILTTILAVPCTGPGLAFALAWSNNQPAYLVYLVFLFIGFGMAAPYIVLGLNPKLISFLPKPGLWMEQLKQVLGFLLLGTVIWLLWTVPLVYMLPAMCFLFGLWFACWWIGSLPITATKSRRLGAWGIAVAASILVGWFSFATLLPAVSGKLDRELSSLIQNSDITLMELESGSNWRHFSMDLLLQEVENNNTLLLDFTADWCATCIALKKAVLNTELVESKIEELGVVKISVDFSKANPDGTELLKRLTGYSQIPVVAIFPAGKADEPIVFVGGYTQSQLLEALDRAGHSKSALPRTSISQR